MEARVYHVGYNAYNSEQQVQSLMQDPKMLLIDTRLKPWSYKPQWSRDDKHVGPHTILGLQSQWGRRYRYAGKYLGNLNYKGGDIDIPHLDEGVQVLVQCLQKGYKLLIICQCSHDSCHRYKILRELKRVMPEVEIYRADGVPEQLIA
jgi:hypothetical protein